MKTNNYLRFFSVTTLIVVLTGCAPCFCNQYMFSDVKGVVLNNGVPVANAEVEQFLDSYGYEKQSTVKVKTNDSGKFEFPAIKRFALVEFFAEPVNEQNITIRYANQEYKGWYYFKHNYRKNGELNKALLLTCDLTAQDKEKQGVSGPAVGICEIN